MTATALRLSPTPPRQMEPSTLRQLLVDRFPDAVLLPDRAIPALATGVAVLDGILPNGGLPRGRVVVWRSPSGEAAGTTAILRSACFGVLEQGQRVAWVDGRNTVGPQWIDGPLLIRPRDESLALTATEILLRSGGFGLVVLTGIDPDQSAMLRISRMVHEGKGAFVALTRRTLTASLRITSRFLPERFQWAMGPFGQVARLEAVTMEITATAPGWSRTATFSVGVTSHDLRLSLDPGLADRRGDLG